MGNPNKLQQSSDVQNESKPNIRQIATRIAKPQTQMNSHNSIEKRNNKNQHYFSNYPLESQESPLHFRSNKQLLDNNLSDSYVFQTAENNESIYEDCGFYSNNVTGFIVADMQSRFQSGGFNKLKQSITSNSSRSFVNFTQKSDEEGELVTEISTGQVKQKNLPLNIDNKISSLMIGKSPLFRPIKPKLLMINASQALEPNKPSSTKERKIRQTSTRLKSAIPQRTSFYLALNPTQAINRTFYGNQLQQNESNRSRQNHSQSLLVNNSTMIQNGQNPSTTDLNDKNVLQDSHKSQIPYQEMKNTEYKKFLQRMKSNQKNPYGNANSSFQIRVRRSQSMSKNENSFSSLKSSKLSPINNSIVVPQESFRIKYQKQLARNTLQHKMSQKTQVSYNNALYQSEIQVQKMKVQIIRRKNKKSQNLMINKAGQISRRLSEVNLEDMLDVINEKSMSLDKFKTKDSQQDQQKHQDKTVQQEAAFYHTKDDSENLSQQFTKRYENDKSNEKSQDQWEKNRKASEEKMMIKYRINLNLASRIKQIKSIHQNKRDALLRRQLQTNDPTFEYPLPSSHQPHDHLHYQSQAHPVPQKADPRSSLKPRMPTQLSSRSSTRLSSRKQTTNTSHQNLTTNTLNTLNAQQSQHQSLIVQGHGQPESSVDESANGHQGITIKRNAQSAGVGVQRSRQRWMAIRNTHRTGIPSQ